MAISHILVLGAGISGLSAAIALSKASTPECPLRVTVIELRAKLTTIGGAVNLTPIAMRYLDHLGAGYAVRSRSHKVDGIDLISQRSGKRLGAVFKDVDAVRVLRTDILESLMETIQKDHADKVEFRWGVRVASITEADSSSDDGGQIILECDNGDTFKGDLLLGCDGIHSSVRRLYVDPDVQRTYTGRIVAMGFAELPDKGDAIVRRADGAAAVESGILVQGQQGALLATFYEPTRAHVYLASVMGRDEPEGDSREGWRLAGADGKGLKEDLVRRWRTGGLTGVEELLSHCDEWNLYPVYKLPKGVAWRKGRVLLIGDAGHAMPPQGESSAYAMEDAVLLAHVLSRRQDRSLDKMLQDYETLRRPVIDKYYDQAVTRWEMSNKDSSWLWAYIMEWISVIYLWTLRFSQEEHFASDVGKLELPP